MVGRPPLSCLRVLCWCASSDTVSVRDVSRWGSPVVPVQSAGALLRARAMAAGVDVRWVSPVELSGAVIGADAWMALLGSSSLDYPQRYGMGAVRALSAVLLRASGCGQAPVEVSTLGCALSHDLLALAEEHQAWAEQLCPGRGHLALSFAASDLDLAGDDSVLSAYAALLQVVSMAHAQEGSSA